MYESLNDIFDDGPWVIFPGGFWDKVDRNTLRAYHLYVWPPKDCLSDEELIRARFAHELAHMLEVDEEYLTDPFWNNKEFVDIQRGIHFSPNSFLRESKVIALSFLIDYYFRAKYSMKVEVIEVYGVVHNDLYIGNDRFACNDANHDWCDQKIFEIAEKVVKKWTLEYMCEEIHRRHRLAEKMLQESKER